MSLDYWRREALRWLDDAFEDLRVAEDLLRSEHYSASYPAINCIQGRTQKDVSIQRGKS